MQRHQQPFSQACENNKHAILEVLQRVFAGATRVIEIGSGTGQHAVHFAPRLPDLQWMTGDVATHHAGIKRWLDAFPAPNLHPPLELDVRTFDWNTPGVDAIYSANTARIMHWPEVELMLRGAGGLLPTGGVFALYGPFNIGGAYTSPGNQRFDASLRGRDPGMGIRDLEAVEDVARTVGLTLDENIAMPANNRTLIWRKHE